MGIKEDEKDEKDCSDLNLSLIVEEDNAEENAKPPKEDSELPVLAPVPISCNEEAIGRVELFLLCSGEDAGLDLPPVIPQHERNKTREED